MNTTWKTAARSGRYMVVVALLVMVSACGDDDDPDEITSGLNRLHCLVRHPLCIEKGVFDIKNGASFTNIVNVAIVSDCDSGWGSGRNVTIEPGGSREFAVDADTHYDIRVMFADDRCDLRRSRSVVAGEQEEIDMKYSQAVCTC